VGAIQQASTTQSKSEKTVVTMQRYGAVALGFEPVAITDCRAEASRFHGPQEQDFRMKRG
jgi:hypothetical protein